MTAPEQMLKPCPFCGCGADVTSYASCDCCGQAWNGRVSCSVCHAECSHFNTDAAAITAWNTRPAPAELVEALTRFERRMTRATHNVGPAVKGDYVRVHKSDWHLLMDIAREARTALRNAGAAS